MKIDKKDLKSVKNSFAFCIELISYINNEELEEKTGYSAENLIKIRKNFNKSLKILDNWLKNGKNPKKRKKLNT
jgi:uncharacterized protein YggE